MSAPAVYFNRPEKRNAMNPALNVEMYEVLDALEGDDRAKVVVLTGAGTSWSAGMDLKEYFRETDRRRGRRVRHGCSAIPESRSRDCTRSATPGNLGHIVEHGCSLTDGLVFGRIAAADALAQRS